MVVNVHRRKLEASSETVGVLIDGLASADDRLWPHEWWPAMRFDRPLGVGAEGGHGPIRYTVEWYEPGAGVWFRFTGPAGFDGGHGFFAHPDGDRTLLENRLEMKVHGPARISWPLLLRPLHDALMEDALWKAGGAMGEDSPRPRWSRRVRCLRRMAARQRSPRR